MSQRTNREIPYQDYTKVKEGVYKKRRGRGYFSPCDLFVDPSFPPDWSSLTYVYSGDDKYEKTVFKRPIEIVENPVLAGVGGVCDEDFPWKTWKQRGWFHAAVNVISLGLRHMEKLIPSYKNFEHNFDVKYIGAFRFNLWRFGEWVEVVVDDFLPILNESYFFCSPQGCPPEFWCPLIEKAYAKCKKTFQAIEYGNILDALTDLTGAICEFYTPDVNPPENFFHILYKTSLNRSMIICWRNNKRLTESAFDFDDLQKESFGIVDDSKRYLHLITAVTKFPMTDKRTINMVRLKCPFVREPKWKGRFSELDSKSWNTINSDFKEKFRPLSRKEEDEFWMTMDDFRCNYGGLFIISSTEPFSTDGLKLDRKFRPENGLSLRINEVVSDTLHLGKPVLPSDRYSVDPKHSRSHASACFGCRNKNKNFSNISHLAVREARSSRKVDNSKQVQHREHLQHRFNPSDHNHIANKETTLNENLHPWERDSRHKPLPSESEKHRGRNNNDIAQSVSTKLKMTYFYSTKDKPEHAKKKLAEKKQMNEKENGIDRNSQNGDMRCPKGFRKEQTTLNGDIRCLKQGQATLNGNIKYPNSVKQEQRTLNGEITYPNSVKQEQRTLIDCHDISRQGQTTLTDYRNSVRQGQTTLHDYPRSVRQEQRTLHDYPNSLRQEQTTLRDYPREEQTTLTDHPDKEGDNSSHCGERISSVTSSSTTISSDQGSGSNCTSEISLHFHPGQNTDDLSRPRSAPVPRNNSEGSIGSLTQSHFLATKTDFFKSQGRWKVLFEHKDCWTKDRQGVSRSDMDGHSKSPRILFTISRTNDVTDPNLLPRMNGKRHVIISLLQDYRHGPSTANSLLLPIGFCLYKAKNIDRDDKRHLSKLQLIGQLDGQAEVREVNARFDLEPGGFILVPYCLTDPHEGEFLIRILAEWDLPGGRPGCSIS